MSAATVVTTERAPSVLWTLARFEMRRYLRHPLYLVGAALLGLSTIALVSSASRDSSPLSAPIAPAFLMGVFGVVVTAQLARSGHKVGAAAGMPPVPERTRTLALAVALAVPTVTAAAWVVAFLGIYTANPPKAQVWWFDDLGSAHVLSMLVGTGVVAAFGGPALGLVVSRWVRWRAAPLVVALLLVVTGMVTQTGSFPARLRLVMPWTQWAAGVTDDHAVYLPGNPGWWLVYAVLLCALGVVVSMLHDPQSDRRRLRAVAAVLVLLAASAVTLSATTGATHARYLPAASSTSA
jgi:hypothetical protein